MTQDTKSTWRVIVLAFLAMLALPVAYRIWIAFNPPAPRPAFSLSAQLAKASADRAAELLVTPLSAWTEADRAAEPQIAAWLEGHARTVLPWEWTDEARRKDPKNYIRAWTRVLDGLEGTLDDTESVIRKAQGLLVSALSDSRTLYAHCTNQLATLEVTLATNELPVTVAVERLTRGRFWGWNRRVEQVRLELAKDRDALLGGLSDQVRGQALTAETLAKELSQMEQKAADVQGRSAKLTACRERLTRLANASAQEREMLHGETVAQLRQGVVAILNGLPPPAAD